MAKQKSTSVDVNSFASINNFIAQFDEEGALGADYTEMDPSEFIHTGNYMFNAQISGSILKGCPNNKIVALPGDPKTGKTYLIMNMVANFQKAGYFAIIWETENAWSRDRMEKQGINLKQCRITQPKTVSDVIVAAVQILDELMKLKKAKKPTPKLCFVLDSQSGLNNKKEYEDALEGDTKTDMGTTAKDLKKLYNMTTVDCGKLGIAFLTTAHVRDEQIGKFTSKKMSGGQAALYLASILALLTKTMDYDEKTKERKGVKVKSNIMESRFSRHRSIEMYIPFDKPMNEYLGLEQYLSWSICGIDKGKFVELVDFGNEFLLKKLVTKQTISGFEFTSDDLLKQIAKTKHEGLNGSIEYFLDNGLMTANGDIFKFHPKIMENFKLPTDALNFKVLCDMDKIDMEGAILPTMFKFDDKSVLDDNTRNAADLNKDEKPTQAELTKKLIVNLISQGFLVKANGEYKITKKYKEQMADPQYQKIEDVVAHLNPNSPTWAIKHLKKAVPTQHLYKAEVFTRQVLEQIDEIIRPLFEYGEHALENSTLDIDSSSEANEEFAEFFDKSITKN